MTAIYQPVCLPLDISTHILTKRMTIRPERSISHGRYFNSHPHEEDDFAVIIVLVIIIYFNSHPHEEDDGCHITWCPYFLYFNSHPHEEDDICKLFCICCNRISTHILTKRMTFSVVWKFQYCHISTHILTKRMTIPTETMNVANINISTHILTKRMTTSFKALT